MRRAVVVSSFVPIVVWQMCWRWIYCDLPYSTHFGISFSAPPLNAVGFFSRCLNKSIRYHWKMNIVCFVFVYIFSIESSYFRKFLHCDHSMDKMLIEIDEKSRGKQSGYVHNRWFLCLCFASWCSRLHSANVNLFETFKHKNTQFIYTQTENDTLPTGAILYFFFFGVYFDLFTFIFVFTLLCLNLHYVHRVWVTQLLL